MKASIWAALVVVCTLLSSCSSDRGSTQKNEPLTKAADSSPANEQKSDATLATVSSGDRLIADVAGIQLVAKEHSKESLGDDCFLKAGSRVFYRFVALGDPTLKEVSSTQREKLYILAYSPGGNACEEEQHIIALTAGGDASVWPTIACYPVETRQGGNGTVEFVNRYDSFRPPIVWRYSGGSLSRTDNNKRLPPDVRTTTHMDPKFLDVPAKYSKTSAYEFLAKNIPAQNAFKRTLGKDFLRLTDRLAMGGVDESAITADGNYFYDEGFMPHFATSEEACICLDLYSGIAYAAILSEGRTIRYYGGPNENYMPPPVEEWILKHDVPIQNRRPGP